jgi:hypothetical protein
VAPHGLKPTPVSADDAALEAPLFHGTIQVFFVYFVVHEFVKLTHYAPVYVLAHLSTFG